MNLISPLHPMSHSKTLPSWLWPLAAGSLASMLLLTGCQRSTSDSASGATPAQATASAPHPAADPLLVDIKPAMAAQFRVAPLQAQEVSTVQEIAGRIDTNERLLTRIGAAVTGRVTEVLVEVGDSVRSGQTLARIASPELTTAQLAYLRAKSNADLAERAVERARQLIAADVIGTAELQRRESELAIARAETRASADQLRLMGIAPEGITRLRDQGNLTPVANVTATLSGVVIERKVAQGQVEQPGDQLFTVADLSSVWVHGALPEQAAQSVQIGQKIDVQVPALGNRHLTGKVIFISDTISPETRTVTVRTQVDNPRRELKPQMLATMRVTGQSQSQLVLPAGAVVREGDRDHVFVQTAPLQFRLTPVELGPASEGLRPVTRGLAAGTPVVVSGAFHLNNERKRAELE